MANSTKLYRRLSALSLTDLKRFQDFLNSPFFNRQHLTGRLFQLLTSFHPHYDVDEEWLFGKLFPEEKYNNSRLRSLRANLLKLLHRFLLQLQLEEMPVVQEELMVEAFRAKGLYEVAGREVEKALQTLQPDTITNFEQARRWTFMERARLDLGYKMGRRPEALKAGELLESLDHYYLARRFEILVGIEANGQMWDLGKVFTGELETQILAERSGLLDRPLIAIYHLLLTSLRQNAGRKGFQKLRELIKTHPVGAAPYPCTSPCRGMSSLPS